MSDRKTSVLRSLFFPNADVVLPRRRVAWPRPAIAAVLACATVVAGAPRSAFAEELKLDAAPASPLSAIESRVVTTSSVVPDLSAKPLSVTLFQQPRLLASSSTGIGPTPQNVGVVKGLVITALVLVVVILAVVTVVVVKSAH